MIEEISKYERVDCGWDSLCVGVECGGSDAMSGVTANPLVGATGRLARLAGRDVVFGAKSRR